MNWFRDKLQIIAAGMLVAIALAAGATIWYQRTQLTTLAKQLTDANSQHAEDKSLINQRDLQIGLLASVAAQSASDYAATLQRFTEINRTAMNRMAQLDTITHEDANARAWGDTRLPAAVIRLLDYPASVTANPASGATDLPASGALRDASQPTTD